MDLDAIRKNYPITTRDIYLNHAATTPISRNCITRMQSLAAQMERPLQEHFYSWLGIIEETRRLLSELVHAHPSEIAFCQNTSTALSMIANAIPFNPGDRILVPRNEFPANIYVWQNLQKKGVEFSFFDVIAGEAITETVAKLDLRNVKLISISAVSYQTGRLYELKSLADFCHAHHILLCYDAIQAVGATPISLSEVNVDFLACGAQKWLLAGTGVGFFYARNELLEKLNVPYVGWTSVKYPEDFSLKELDFSTEMTRFEPGLPSILPFASLNQSLRDLTAIGFNEIFTRIKGHTQYLTAALNSLGIQTFAQNDLAAGIVSFKTPPRLNGIAFQSYLKKHRLHVTYRDNYFRVSPHFYSLKKELDIFLAGLDCCQQSHYLVPNKKVPLDTNKKIILISGATGILGNAFAHELASRGYSLMLIGRDQKKLTMLGETLQTQYKTIVQTACADFTDPISFNALLTDLQTLQEKFIALINCAGVAYANELTHLSAEKLQTMFQVNCTAAFKLMQLFVTQLQAPNALGILTIVDASARVGTPLLSGYAASHAARFSLSEVFGRELSKSNLTICTYVAPPMHSRLQKYLGRLALRYFKLSGEFPYAEAKGVAKEAWEALLNKKSIFVNKYHRRLLWINALFPNWISKKIKRIWKA